MNLLNKILFKFFKVRIIFSQFGEDLIIESIISNKKDGIYVDIGANHPIKFNNTFLFYKKGWRGINIEPNPNRFFLFKLFRKKDINLNIGIGKENSTLDFYIFKEDTLCTFEKDVAKKYQNMGHKLKKIKKINVFSLKEIFIKNLKHRNIDILTIDTEGYDMEVLKSNDWNIYRPDLIILETLEYKKDRTGKKLNYLFDPYMESIGYNKIADTYINTIYKKEY